MDFAAQNTQVPRGTNPLREKKKKKIKQNKIKNKSSKQKI
ncbi:hypothetical protein QG37_06559 [Candidozyma auris]|uniref:Uncharacterized protein n=1 Tax=Candidozyma auris TaxID=498019 RepID=A0A0L0NTN7_CANAR|nr:hypothetical protein QG37_06559 [[Candida] auris]